MTDTKTEQGTDIASLRELYDDAATFGSRADECESAEDLIDGLDIVIELAWARIKELEADHGQ